MTMCLEQSLSIHHAALIDLLMPDGVQHVPLYVSVLVTVDGNMLECQVGTNHDRCTPVIVRERDSN